MRERERKISPRFLSMIHGVSSIEFVKTRAKVHHLDEGYAHIPKGDISPKIQRGRFGEIKFFLA